MHRPFHERAIAFVTLASFIGSMLPRPARAENEANAQPVEVVAPKVEPTPTAPVVTASGSGGTVAPAASNGATASPPKEVALPTNIDTSNVASSAYNRDGARAVSPASVATAQSPVAPVAQSLPNGVETTGVSSQVLSLPQGAGKIEGMGESFSNQLSTGTATYTVPIALPGARGNADPKLALTYSTSGGHGVAGLGWELGVPYIARQTGRGNPLYEDPPAGGAWTPTQDRFVFNGGQELVPICLVSGASCAGAQATEIMPSWASGWQYFRPRIEGSFLRFFWSPDHQTWRVQDKNGVSMEIGVPLDGTSQVGTLETDTDGTGRVFRWNISRQYDAYGTPNPAAGATPEPVNIVRYAYVVDGGLSYLSDVYDTPPATASATAAVTTYAHHAHLSYDTRTDVDTSYRRGWKTVQDLRLVSVDVTSEPFNSMGTPRKLVRRYHLAYDPSYHVSLLTSVQVEGRCGAVGAGEGGEPNAEDSDGLLPTSNCPMLPAMTFAYTHVAPYESTGAPGVADLAGYEGFDERVTTMVGSPTHSVDESNADLFDVNADGLPDVVVTMPGLYNGQQGLYLSGYTGQANSFTASTMGVVGVNGDDTTTITLDNPNISSGDILGDGVIQLINMPQVKTYSVYQPAGSGLTWNWIGRSITTASAQSTNINLGANGLNVQRMDVNGDGLVDIVLSQGTEMQTFFSLDRYPGGDGQFGYASWTSATTASLSNSPVTSCVPWDGVPVQFSDPTIELGDMNGDGLQDIVRVEQGNVHYWPGRGNGYWGTAPSASACPGGTFGDDQYVAMQASPELANPDTAAVRVDDVNGDGLDDLVVVNFTTVEVYLNVDGVGWTAAHVIANAPASPSYLSRVRIVDINGSGTRDILWGDGGDYRFMDLSGGARPWMLTHVENGLGKTTDIDYAASTSLMLAAAAAKTPWTSVTPNPVEVVTKTTVSDNLSVAGNAPGQYVTQYSYANPVYDGRQREFRGFETATETRLGDANSPTSNTQSQFLLGQCQDDEPGSPLPSACLPAGRWRDNVREALKGLPTVVQSYDTNGVYLSTIHHTYRLRLLYVGADGREVRHAFESATDTYLYDGPSDTASSNVAPTTVTTSDVELELAPPAYSTLEESSTPAAVATQQSGTMVLQGGAGQAHLQKSEHVDVFGNTYHAIDSGCVSCTPIDPVITNYEQPNEVSGNTGWLWRNTDTYVSGTTDIPAGEPLDHTITAFNAQGDPLTTSKVLQGTLALARSNTGTGGTAPAPTNASKDGTSVVMTLGYDGFGNVTSSTAANDRCRTTTFDGPYTALPVSDTIWAGPLAVATKKSTAPVCGTTALVTGATYDRGLTEITTLTDIRGETTKVSFDGFGRLGALYRPDPDTGAASSVPSKTVSYQLPTDPRATPYSLIQTETQDGPDPSVASYRETLSYVDGLARTVVSLQQADPGAGDAAPWVATGVTTYDAKDAPELSYLDYFYGGDTAAFLTTVPSGVPSTRQTYDAFGRSLEAYALDGTLASRNVYHALSVDAWDAADLTPTSGHYGTFSTAQKDGHGRPIVAIERAYVGQIAQVYETSTTYQSTGERVQITRSNLNLGAKANVTRWMRYDSLGRMVANVEPDTTVSATGNPSGAVPAKTWRYAYNDDGDLVGTSDARGCGVNYAYDAAGRNLSEDYSPCTADQSAYSSAAEVTYLYDVQDPQAENGQAIELPWYFGHLASTTDRSGKTIPFYDGRGRTIAVDRLLVGPGGTLAPRRYALDDFYDADDRVVEESSTAFDAASCPTGSACSATTPVSDTTTTFSKRSLITKVSTQQATTAGSGVVPTRAWTVIASVKHDADKKPLEIVYGDAAPTTTSMLYDGRRRLSSVQTYRGPPGIWTNPGATYSPPPAYGGPPSSFQLLLQDLDYKYDVVNNPVEVDDLRTPSEWPAGALPVTRTMQYDDLYRLTKLAYAYTSATGVTGTEDPWTSPFSAENTGLDPDPQRATPVPQIQFPNRVNAQTFAYDWLGNSTSTGDDSGGFYDRSLGTITNGTASAGPYQLQSASSTTGSNPGSLTTSYDAAGNLTGLSVTRSGTCLPSGAVCSQQYLYSWDEVGRLARARRWDLASPGAAGTLPTGTPAADLSYTYDASDDRAIKQATDGGGNVRYTLYPLDAIELRQTTWDATTGDYDRLAATEVPYVFAKGVRLGRVALSDPDDPDPKGATHLFLELPDHLGSTSVVVDADTSELVEAATYLPYGGAESDYRPARWSSFREDYRFTGKEEDVQVGLSYFGKRYLAANLNRWISADPLTLHGLKASLNVYGYVDGRVFLMLDRRGLDGASFFSPGGTFGQWIVHQDTVTFFQNDRTLQKIQYGAAAVTIVATSYLTAGATAKVAIAMGASTQVAGAFGMAAAGVTYRGAVAAVKGDSPKEAAKKALDPVSVATDFALGGQQAPTGGAPTPPPAQQRPPPPPAPPAVPDAVVTAKFTVGGQSFTDVNPLARVPRGEGATVPGLRAPNADLRTAHAEIGAMMKSVDVPGLKGAHGELVVTGEPVCNPYCKGDVKTVARALGLGSLTVTDSTGTYTFSGPELNTVKEGGKGWKSQQQAPAPGGGGGGGGGGGEGKN